ncbi:hypothetical protein BSSX_p0120 (plasmid) [Bacillus subtilis]|nr:hypothetical protein BSSX_p0120 [Bacillus subtilis]
MCKTLRSTIYLGRQSAKEKQNLGGLKNENSSERRKFDRNPS